MALTSQQREQIAQAIAADANRRGVDHTKLAMELFELLLQPKATQVQELRRLVSRRQTDLQNSLAEFDADTSIRRTKLEDENTQLAALLTELT